MEQLVGVRLPRDGYSEVTDSARWGFDEPQVLGWFRLLPGSFLDFQGYIR